MSCRLCSNSENLGDIFGTDFHEIEGMDLDTCIEITTGVKITPKDTMSLKICKACFTSVEEYMEFRKNCFRSSLDQLVQAVDAIQVDTPPSVGDSCKTAKVAMEKGKN